MQIFHNNLEVIVEGGEYVFPSLFIISTDIHICTSIIMRSISVIGKSKAQQAKEALAKGKHRLHVQRPYLPGTRKRL
jgi:hypothetical protein